MRNKRLKPLPCPVGFRFPPSSTFAAKKFSGMARLRPRKLQRDASILKPKKPKKLKLQTKVLKTGRKPASSLPQSSSDHEQNLEPHQGPCLDITLPSQHLCDFDPKSFSTTHPIQSMPSSPKTPDDLAIVPYNNPSLKPGTLSSRKKGKSPMTCHWNKKKMETLTMHFNPIPFLPKKVPPLDIASHQSLLSTLGLWDFFHLDFDQKLRLDLIKELVVLYSPKRHPYCKSYVNGQPITLSRAALGKALYLPLKSRSLVAKGGDKDGLLMVSEEEAVFLEEIVWSCLVLQDDGSKVRDEVLKFTRSVRERRLEEVDWAGLIWFMMERELSKGQDLVNCYYASHMQILLKHQRPKLFASEEVENVFREEANLLDVQVENALGEESNLLDLQMVDVEDSRHVDKQLVLFDEEFRKESVASVVRDAAVTEVGLENENILVRCYKRKTEYFEKCRKERKLCIVDDLGNTITTRDCEGGQIENQQNDVYLLDGEFGNKQQIKVINHDQHEYELESMNDDEKVGENVDELKGDEMDHQQGILSCMPAKEGKDLESSSSVGMLKNLDKVEVSTEIVSSEMGHLNWQERDNQQLNVAAKQENGERKSSLDVSEEGVKNAVNMLTNEDTHDEGLKTEQLTDQHEYELESMNDDEKVGENVDELKGDEMDHQQGKLSCMPAKEGKDLELSSSVGMLKNLDKVEVSTEIVSSEMGHLNWRERDNQQLNVAAKQENGERKSSLDVSEEGVKNAVNMLTNEDTHDEGLKTEQLTDLTLGGVDGMDIQGLENQPTYLISNQKNGEKDFGIEGSLEEKQHVRGESILDEHHTTQTEPVIELMVVQGEKEVEEMEGLAKEVCKVEIGELLDNGEKMMQKVDLSAAKHDTSHENALKEGVNQKGHASLHVSEEGVKNTVNVLMNEDTHEEGLEIKQLTDLTLDGVDGMDIQGTENQQTCLVSNQENGEKDFSMIGAFEEEQHVRAESILDEQHATQTEPGIELIVEQGEKEVAEMEGLAKEVCKVEIGELLDTGEKVTQKLYKQVDLSVAKHNTSHENALKEEVNREGHASAESVLDEQHATQTEPGNEWVVVQREEEAEEMDGLPKEVCEAETGELLEKTENVMQHVDLSAEEHNIFHENALEEGVNREYMHLHGSLKRSEENAEPEAMDANEFLRADVFSKQVILTAKMCKGGSDHHMDTTEAEIICLEREENDKRERQLRKSNASEDSVLQQCAPTNFELPEIHKGKIQVVEANISNDLPKEALAKEICEAEIHKSLDNREHMMQNIQVGLKAEKHIILHENILGEGENQEGMQSSKSDGENFGVDATVWNEILGADNDNMQVTLNAELSKGGSEYATATKREDIMNLEHEENDKRKYISESNISERLVLQKCTPGDVEVTEVHKEKIKVVETNIFHDPPKECTSIEDLYSAYGVQSTCENEMPFIAPNNNFNHSFTELPVPNLDEHIGKLIPSVHAEAQQSKNVRTSTTSLERFESQPDIGMNVGDSSFGNSLKGEIYSLNYSQYEHVTESQKRTENNDAENNESLDLELCTKQMEVWMLRLKNAAKKRAQVDGEFNAMLLRKIEEQSKIIEEQNKIIQQYEKLKNEEQQKKQKDIHRYERELRLIQGVLFDYRKALKEVDKSFSMYRERCQLPEEPLYMDDPCGGGKVILAAEFNKSSRESQNKATQVSIEAMMKNFMHEWVDKFEKYLSELDHLCHKLEDVEISVSLLKGMVLNP